MPNPIIDIQNEMDRQHTKWSFENDIRKSPKDWTSLIKNYAGWAEVMAGMNSPDKYRNRMVQVAALAASAVLAHDLRRMETDDE